MASASEMFDQLVANFKNSTLGQKIAAFVIVAAVLGGLLSLTMVGTKMQYQVLYSGLTQEDAAAVVARLKDERIPYQLANEGGTVLVPAPQVHDVRLALASAGLPRGGGVGFEVFDKTSLGTTDFVQRLNYQRAVQGELSRTIRQFQQVEEARVHIATPKDSVFIEDRKPTTASVSLKLRGQQQLAKSEVKAIVHLVASAVPGLTPENVAVVDTVGRLLYRGQGGQDTFLTDSQLEYQMAIEEKLRRKIETMIAEVVGEDHVRARVTAEMDFSRVDYTEENFDPEGQVVRSEQLQTEGEGEEGGQYQGIPGVKGELAGLGGYGGVAESGAGFQRKNITRNYEISRQTKRVQEASGTIRRLSVAVMVDGSYERGVGADGQETMQYKPRSAEEMQRFDKLVKNAIGYSEEREDQVELANVSFATAPAAEPVRVETADKLLDWVERYGLPYAVPAFGILMVFLFGRALLKILASRPVPAQRPVRRAPVGEAYQASTEEPLEEEDLYLQPKPMTDREKIARLAQSNPDRAADLVRRWLREEG